MTISIELLLVPNAVYIAFDYIFQQFIDVSLDIRNESHCEKTCLWGFQTRSDTNRAVQT